MREGPLFQPLRRLEEVGRDTQTTIGPQSNSHGAGEARGQNLRKMPSRICRLPEPRLGS